MELAKRTVESTKKLSGKQCLRVLLAQAEEGARQGRKCQAVKSYPPTTVSPAHSSFHPVS